MSNWHIFTGSHVAHDGLKRLPDPPPWRDYTKKADQAAKFQSDDRQIEVVNAALYLRRPLLVTGSPGSGKSSLAFAVANELGLGEVLRWNINSRSTREEGLYSYDAIARLRDTNPNAPSSEERIGEYIRLGPLGTAIALSEAKRPRVVLIDEIDKSDIDLPNDLLHVLEDGEFEIPELKRIAVRTGLVKVQGADRDKPTEVLVPGGKVQGGGFPFVLLTSNGERELPPAFFRRCLRLDLDPPKDEELRKQRLRSIVVAHLGALDGKMLEDLLKSFVDKQKTGILATDQLLNALFLIDRGKLPEGEERERLEAILLRELGAPMERDLENQLADRVRPLLNALMAESPELTADELADVLWLALRLPKTPSSKSASDSRSSDMGRSGPEKGGSKAGTKPPTASRPPKLEPTLTESAGIYLPTDIAQSASRPGRPVRVPTPSALSRSRELARALRPLKRRAPSPFRTELDVAGTVQRIAEEQIQEIVFRPALDRWLSVSVVIDASASMGVWQSTARKFADLLDRMGAFRRLQVWHWRIEEPGCGLSPATWVPGTATAPRPAAVVIDTSGPHVIMVVTDCIAPPWHDGTAANVIQKWTRRAHVALVSPLPESCWDRTALTEEGSIALTARIAAAPNDRLIAQQPAAGEARPADEHTLKIPVVSLRSFPLGQWAALMIGRPGIAAIGQLFPLHPAPDTIRAPEPALVGEEALKRFWTVASPMARKLARYLAAVPVIGLPVIRLVRQELLQGEAEQVHEAEVFLGGLLRVHAKAPGPPDPERTVYEFMPGVRELLLDSLPAVEAVEVHQRVSEYLAKNWGQGSDFSGVVVDESGAAVPMTTEALGTVRVDVLRRAGVPVSREMGVSVRTQLAPIRILLLAGLQFSDEYRSQSSLVRTALVAKVRSLANSGQKPDLVAVAGDVAREGRPAQYAEAAAWLNTELLTALAPFDPANVFIVPGNHDLWDEIGVTVSNLRSSGRVHSALTDVWKRRRKSLQAAHGPFCEFTRAYRAFDFDPAAQGSVLSIRGLRVGVVCLASAWSRIVPFREDRLTKFVGRMQVKDAFQRVRGADVRIVLLHHPIERLEEPDRSRVLEVLERENCRLVLHGPYRPPEPNASVHVTPWRGLEVGTGQLFSSGDSVAPQPYFAAVEVEPGAGQVRVHPFGWKGVSEGWVDASSAVADQWQFTLGNLLVKRNEPFRASVPPANALKGNAPGESSTASKMTSGVSIQEIRDAILDAYDPESLEMSVALLMNEQLADITPPGPFADVVFSLIRWAEMNGRDAELVQAIGKDRARNAKIQQIYKKYGMAVAVEVKRDPATATDSADSGLERIIKSHVSDFALWREELATVEGQVCRITFNGIPEGTGFLVGPDAVLTCYCIMQKVIDGSVPATGVQCEFDFKLLADGSTTLKPVGLAGEWLLDFSRFSESEARGTPDKVAPTADELDYALIQLSAPIGSQPWAKSPGEMAPARGWIQLPDHPVEIPETMPIIIAQHARGLPMKLAIDAAGVDKSKGLWLNAVKNRLRYAPSTEGGASGSPCFDFNWRLVALHHYKDPGLGPPPRGNPPTYGQGVLISEVVARIVKKPKALAALGGFANRDSEFAAPSDALTFKLTRLLRTALESCFDEKSLRAFIELELAELDQRLRNEINYNADTVAVDLVIKAVQLGLSKELARRILAARPAHPAAQALREPFDLDGEVGGRTQYPQSVRDTAIRFHERMIACHRSLVVIRVNKGLHDILHQLERMQQEIERLLSAAAQPGFDLEPASDTIDSLTNLQKKAEEYVSTASHTDRRRRWVDEFVHAAETVSRQLSGDTIPADSSLERAIMFLAHLPSEQQPDLHERLRDAADSLDVAGMEKLVGELRRALPQTDADKLAEGYSQFVEHCTALTRLIEQHNFCQLIDLALREADGLPGATAGMLSNWSDAKSWVEQLSSGRPDDISVRRLVESVEKFGNADPASAAAAFEKVRARFKIVFFDIDAQLLNATEQMLQTANVLDVLLRRFMS